MHFQDKQFGKITLFYGHQNPSAVVESQIKPYKQFTLNKAYRGDSFFWGLLPQQGDHLRFKFVHPIFIKRYNYKKYSLKKFLDLQFDNKFVCFFRYLFRSGNAEHPSDKFYNTTVEVLPQSSSSVNRNHNNVTEDGYIIIGNFIV